MALIIASRPVARGCSTCSRRSRPCSAPRLLAFSRLLSPRSAPSKKTRYVHGHLDDVRHVLVPVVRQEDGAEHLEHQAEEGHMASDRSASDQVCIQPTRVRWLLASAHISSLEGRSPVSATLLPASFWNNDTGEEEDAALLGHVGRDPGAAQRGCGAHEHEQHGRGRGDGSGGEGAPHQQRHEDDAPRHAASFPSRQRAGRCSRLSGSAVSLLKLCHNGDSPSSGRLQYEPCVPLRFFAPGTASTSRAGVGVLECANQAPLPPSPLSAQASRRSYRCAST